MSEVDAEARRDGLGPGGLPVLAVLVPLVLAVVAGGAGGLLWWTWWGPAPAGKIYDTDAGPHWYPDPFDPGITRDFSGTAEFVVVGFALALVVGVVGGLLARRQAVAGLVAVVVASGVGCLLMTVVGLLNSPADPQDKAHSVKIGTALPGHLAVTGWTPYLAWPVGALLGFLVVMLALRPRTVNDGSPRPEPRSAEPAPLD